MRPIVRTWFAIAATGMLAACASTAPYPKAVDAFAEATRQAEASMRDLAAPIPGERERLLAIALTSPDKLVVQGCSTGDADCRLAVEDDDGQEKLLDAAEAAPKSRALLAEISGYAKDLKALALADREEEIAVALNGVTAGVSSLAGLAGKAVSPKAAIGNRLVAFFTGQYLETLKLQALKDATAEADPVIAEATNKLATIQRFLVEDRLTLAQSEFSAARRAFAVSRQQPRPTKLLADLEEAGRKLNGLAGLRETLAAGGPSLFSRMRDAHAALTKALHEEQPKNFDTALAAVGQFLGEAERFTRIVETLD